MCVPLLYPQERQASSDGGPTCLTGPQTPLFFRVPLLSPVVPLLSSPLPQLFVRFSSVRAGAPRSRIANTSFFLSFFPNVSYPLSLLFLSSPACHLLRARPAPSDAPLSRRLQPNRFMLSTAFSAPSCRSVQAPFDRKRGKTSDSAIKGPKFPGLPPPTTSAALECSIEARDRAPPIVYRRSLSTWNRCELRLS